LVATFKSLHFGGKGIGEIGAGALGSKTDSLAFAIGLQVDLHDLVAADFAINFASPVRSRTRPKGKTPLDGIVLRRGSAFQLLDFYCLDD
jgi:hypothetical protein